ncbi:glycosyltransferase [Arthrobacter sp. SAFR-044]|uniref:glycosyltransferase n=1 Tax=Arthrobacter sp. SAFR-044 TaxID=3387278 RepID=UPI003F7B4E4B
MSQPNVDQERRVPVSVVCVFNNPAVLQECLTASVAAGHADAPDIEYLPVDNTARQFSSAGAALNHGAALARHDVVVFVHQDVFLHSIPALEKVAAALMADLSLGMVGATGMTGQGHLLGLIRDRIVLSGRQEAGLADVDSLDEVLFMVRRDQILRHALSQEPDLAWHAYAVEYGARLRSMGSRVVVANIPLTHNSLTINLDRLAEAHQWIAGAYPDQLPIVTTCGTVRQRAGVPAIFGRLLTAQKWRYRWLRESVSAHKLRNRSAVRPVTVLGDLRRDIDDICTAAGVGAATIISALPESSGMHELGKPLELSRRGVRFSFLTVDEAAIAAVVSAQEPGSTVAVTNISFDAAREVVGSLAGRRVILGFHENTGAWLLTGPSVDAAEAHYRTPRSTPLAMKVG